MPSERKRRPKWHIIYYALAAFDVLAVCSSLTLSHQIMGIYRGSVEENHVWAERVSALTTLGRMAQETNAPGNDVFDTKAVAKETAARNKALLTFRKKLLKVQADFEQNIGGEDQHKLIEKADLIRGAMDQMVLEADQIFGYFKSGEPALAGTRMASMDRKYADLTNTIATASEIVQGIQERNFNLQLAEASNLRRFEYLIGGFILFMVGGITVYGHKIAQVMQKNENDLTNARNEAEQANRAKSEFLANMSHELRTPLNAVIGFSDMMRLEKLGPVGSVKYREYSDDINQAGTHLLSLINDILDLSKIEAGKDELYEETLEIRGVINSTETLVRHRAEQNNIAMKMEIEGDLPELRADERKLKQILVNLLTNAIKYTEPGGTVTINAWCRRDSGFVFQIADTGIGIAPQDISKALAKFGQVDSALNRKYDGTGLGLPLTKALVELHGGSLDLQSEVGAGTTVTVRLPAWRIVSEKAIVAYPATA